MAGEQKATELTKVNKAGGYCEVSEIVPESTYLTKVDIGLATRQLVMLNKQKAQIQEKIDVANAVIAALTAPDPEPEP